MPPPLPDDKRAAILQAIKAGGKSQRQIGKDHGVSDATVRRIAKDAGLADAWSRDKTQKATEARVADNKAARTVEAAETIAVAAQIRVRILDAKDGRDAQGWATAYGIMIDKHGKLIDMDADVQGLAAVDAWLRDITGQP